MASDVMGTATEQYQTTDSVRLRELEASLRDRERDLREAQQAAHFGTWRWVAATDSTTWSEEVYRVFGFDPAGPAPGFDQIREMHSPESRARLEASVTRALTTGEPYEHDIKLVMPDGSIKWIIACGRIESSENGIPTVLRGTVQDITERKLAEEELQRSENRYRSLIHATSDIVWISSPQGTQTGEIPAWRAFTGQSIAEVQGFGWSAAIHPDDRDDAIDSWQKATADGSNYVIRHRLRRHDGVYRMMLCSAVPSRDSDGTILEWVGMHTDITEQVEAELALRDANARFEKLYAANLIGICYPDRFGAFSEGNQEFLRITGYTEADLRAGLVRWDTMTPPEYGELDIRHITQAAAQGSCTPYEKEYIRKDGTRVPIVCGYALREGSTDEYTGFILDLSAQRQAELATREREFEFKALADTIPQLVWVSDAAGNKTYVNQRFLEYSGLSAEQVHGPMWNRLLHPDDAASSLQKRAHSIRTGDPYLDEYRIRRHDGQFRSFLVRAIPVRNDAGEIERWLGSATDIHDQKLAEEALRRSEKLAATGRLAASIAHEINNPLEAVTNSLYLALMDDGLDPETRSYLKIAEQELARVAQVTTQTLRFHRQSVAAAEVDLAELMDSAFSLFAPRFAACEITVDRDYKPGQLLHCRGDEMRQVFVNFLSNALDATRQGGRVRIRIRPGRDCRAATCPGVRVTIADTGHGIPAHLRRSIFEPFVSTKDTTGTGLGLWVTEGIVRKHNGHISLRSSTGPNQGTVFSIFFPAEALPPSA